jgi:NADH-quinone oxidoreductase subunit H
MLVTYAVMSASVFLGGYLGPVLPGPVWLGLKSILVMGLYVTIGHLVGRFRVDRFMTHAWMVLLPLSFVALILAGVVAL